MPLENIILGIHPIRTKELNYVFPFYKFICEMLYMTLLFYLIIFVNNYAI